jgi:2-methylisocitrate lyase-like PEP mutase family enzyme
MTETPVSLPDQFLALHHGEGPLLLANAWDVGSAKLFASLGFEALATTSSGFAGTLGRVDGEVTRDEMLAHGAALTEATGLPVSGDLENGYAHDPAAVAETIRLAIASGFAGASIEDYGGGEHGVYPLEAATERVAAAAAAAHATPGLGLVLTARAENHLRGHPDLDDTIARLQAYQEVGADVLFAPGVADLGDIARLVSSVDRPVNVICRPGGPTVAELAEVGVRRISVGGSLYFAGLGAVVDAALELREGGTLGYLDLVTTGGKQARQAFTT